MTILNVVPPPSIVITPADEPDEGTIAANIVKLTFDVVESAILYHVKPLPLIPVIVVPLPSVYPSATSINVPGTGVILFVVNDVFDVPEP